MSNTLQGKKHILSHIKNHLSLDDQKQREGGDIVFVDSENTPRERAYDIEATIEPSESTPQSTLTYQQNNSGMDAVNALIKAKPRASIKNTFLEGLIKPSNKRDDENLGSNMRNRDSLQAEIDKKLKEMREKKTKKAEGNPSYSFLSGDQSKSRLVNDTPFGTEPQNSKNTSKQNTAQNTANNTPMNKEVNINEQMKKQMSGQKASQIKGSTLHKKTASTSFPTKKPVAQSKVAMSLGLDTRNSSVKKSQVEKNYSSTQSKKPTSMAAKSRLEGAVQKDNYNTQAGSFKSNLVTSSLGAKRTQGHKKSQSIQLESSISNQLAQKAIGIDLNKQQTGFGNSRNVNLTQQKSSQLNKSANYVGQKSVGRSSKLDSNFPGIYNSTSKVFAATNPVTPNKTRTRNDTSKVGVRNNSQSVSKLSLGNKAKTISIGSSFNQYNSVSKISPPKAKNISPPKKPIQYSLDLSETKSKPGQYKLQSSLLTYGATAQPSSKVSKPNTAQSSLRQKSAQPSMRTNQSTSPPKKYVAPAAAIPENTQVASTSVQDELSSPMPFTKSSTLDGQFLRDKVAQILPNDFFSFSDEFLHVVETNDFSQETLSKNDFVKVIWDLNFINGQRIRTSFEQAGHLPLITLLWMILTKINKTQKINPKTGLNVATSDVLSILAAILDLQVDDMIKTEDMVVQTTANPLIQRNADGDVVFSSQQDQQKFSLKFQALKTNYNENWNIKQIQKEAEEAAKQAQANLDQSKKARRSKLERSNSKTKYQTAPTFKSQAEVQDVDQEQEQVQEEQVETDQVLQIMDKIRKSNSYLQDLEPEPENNLKTQLVQVPQTEDKIDELMAQYSTNKSHIQFDTSKVDKKKTSASKSNFDSRKKSAGKSDIQDAIKRQEEEIQNQLAVKRAKPRSKNPYLQAAESSDDDEAGDAIDEDDIQLKYKYKQKPLSRQRTNQKDLVKPELKREDSYTDPKTLAAMTTSLLSKIYKSSYSRYENETKKLENKGEVFHLAANVDYRKSLVSVDPDFAKDFVHYERKVTQKLEGVDLNELKWRKTLSFTSMLEEGDEEVYNNCSVDEIMNPIGTVPKDKFKGQKQKMPEQEKKSISPANKFSAKLSKPIAGPPPRKSQNPYLMDLINSGVTKNVDKKSLNKSGTIAQVPSAITATKNTTQFNARRGSPTGATANKRGSPGAFAGRRSPGGASASKRGAPVAPKQKVQQQKVEKKVVKSYKPDATTEKHNSQVHKDNQSFANKLIKKSYVANDFEDSVESVDDSWSNDSMQDSDTEQPKIKGECIVLNVDLGMRGHQIVRGLSNQDPYDIAKDFCKKNRLGPKTRQKIWELLIDKMETFDIFNKIELA